METTDAVKIRMERFCEGTPALFVELQKAREELGREVNRKFFWMSFSGSLIFVAVFVAVILYGWAAAGLSEVFWRNIGG